MSTRNIDNDVFAYANQFVLRGTSPEKIAKLILAAAAKYRFFAHAQGKDVTSPAIVEIEAEVVEAGLDFVQNNLPSKLKLL